MSRRSRGLWRLYHAAASAHCYGTLDFIGPGLRSTIPRLRILWGRSNQEHDYRKCDRPSAPDLGSGQVGPVPRTGLLADCGWPASASLPPAARNGQVGTSRSPRSGLSTPHPWSLSQLRSPPGMPASGPNLRAARHSIQCFRHMVLAGIGHWAARPLVHASAQPTRTARSLV
jgi:hypothetical protein